MKAFRWLWRTFLSGLLIALPLALTVFLIIFLIGLMNAFFSPVTALIQATFGLYIPGIGIYVTIFMVLLFGMFTRHYVGVKTYNYVERFVSSIPIVRRIYGTIKQIIDAVFNRDTTAFRRVVLVEYPRKGIYTIGFVTNEAKGVLGDNLPVPSLSIFIFTVPNPMSGYYIIVPETDVIDLNVSVEEGIRMTVSMGMALEDGIKAIPVKTETEEERHVPV